MAAMRDGEGGGGGGSHSSPGGGGGGGGDGRGVRHFWIQFASATLALGALTTRPRAARAASSGESSTVPEAALPAGVALWRWLSRPANVMFCLALVAGAGNARRAVALLPAHADVASLVVALALAATSFLASRFDKLDTKLDNFEAKLGAKLDKLSANVDELGALLRSSTGRIDASAVQGARVDLLWEALQPRVVLPDQARARSNDAPDNSRAPRS